MQSDFLTAPADGLAELPAKLRIMATSPGEVHLVMSPDQARRLARFVEASMDISKALAELESCCDRQIERARQFSRLALCLFLVWPLLAIVILSIASSGPP